MNPYFTKNPIVGTPLTPSVIKQINTAVRRYMPIAGNGIRTTITAGGTIISAIPAPASKKQKDKPLPFEVRYDGTLDSGAGGWKIYLPTEHLVQFDGAYLDPMNDVTPILDANGDETGWYSFDEITLQDDHVWLVISESSSESSSGSSGAYTASFANAEDQQAVANICIAEVSYEEPEDEGGTPTVEIKQSVVGALHLGGKSDSVTPDDVSTEFIPKPEEGEEPTGDEGKLQIFDFNSDESDSPEGLAERLHADTKTGDIKIQSGTNIMLLARRDGKMVYIPLTAGGTDPEDEKPYDPENPDPCAHPGDNAPGAETHSDGGGGGVPGGGGGVPGGGDIHTGDDDCNCERI